MAQAAAGQVLASVRALRLLQLLLLEGLTSTSDLVMLLKEKLSDLFLTMTCF